MYIVICDLCGKPINPLGYKRATYKIKRAWRSSSLHEGGWAVIDAHDECVKKLLDACDARREAEEDE